MIEAPHYSASGARHPAAFALPADVFDGTVHEPALHQAVKTFLANQRQGTAKTKTRSFISGGNQKPWKQKGTGRARQGSTRAPHWRGGGTVFGPIPRDYRMDIPRKVKQLARRSALNARAREGALFVVDGLTLAAPKTAQLAGLLEKMGLGGRKTLILSNGLNRNLYLSGRNIPDVQVLSYSDASAYDVLWAETVVVEQGAFTGEAPSAVPTVTDAPKAPRAKKPAAAPRAAKGEKKAPARKPAAKKPAPRKKKETD